MRRTALAILTALLFFALTACAKKDGDLLFYQEKAFEGELEVSLGELTASVAVSGGEWTKDGGKRRDIRIKFIAPQTLEGIVLTREDESITVFVEGVPFEDGKDNYSSLALFTDLLELTAVPTSLKTDDNKTLATLACENGDSIYLVLDQEGLPLEITKGDIKIKVISLKIK